jgi:hypothetical protein
LDRSELGRNSLGVAATASPLWQCPTVVAILEFASVGLGAELLENVLSLGRTKMACD